MGEKLDIKTRKEVMKNRQVSPAWDKRKFSRESIK